MAKYEETAVEVLAEATVRPAEPVTETVAEVRVIGSTIEVRFPEKREDFRKLIKFELGFNWSASAWKRTIGPFNGTVEDRVAEVGHRLLAAGFPIRIFDEELRRRAVEGDYHPEVKRWVKKIIKGEYAGWFSIEWPFGENFYNAARKLRGSRWNRETKSVVVPPEQWNEVLDFAEMYGFGVSPGAKELAEQARRIQELALVADVTPKAAEPCVKPSDIPPTLDVPTEVEVDDELRDDD